MVILSGVDSKRLYELKEIIHLTIKKLHMIFITHTLNGDFHVFFIVTLAVPCYTGVSPIISWKTCTLYNKLAN